MLTKDTMSPVPFKCCVNQTLYTKLPCESSDDAFDRLSKIYFTVGPVSPGAEVDHLYGIYDGHGHFTVYEDIPWGLNVRQESMCITLEEFKDRPVSFFQTKPVFVASKAACESCCVKYSVLTKDHKAQEYQFNTYWSLKNYIKNYT